MRKILDWVKANKFTFGLVLVVLYLLFRDSGGYVINQSMGSYSDSASIKMESMASESFLAPNQMYDSPTRETPQLNVSDRKVVTNSNLSLVVSDVSASIEKFQQEAEDLGGYLVNYRTNNPTEAASGNITVRVPANSLKVFLGSLRNNAVKVVSENIDGRDVTDEYMDIESRLVTLRKTRDTFEGIMEKATNVDEILRVQQAIFNVQDQIDNLQGSLMYLDATSQSSLVTIYLSTDEFELPYTPDQPWRPSVVFKYAVRSLVGALRGLGTAAIWIGVYSVVWLPVLIVVYFLRKKRRNRTMTNVM